MTIHYLRTTAILLSFVIVASSNAQSAPNRWSGTAEASGNLLYGAASQRILSTGWTAQRLDDRAELRFEAQGSYGDSRRADSDIRDVTVRNALLRGGVDIRPRARVTPFSFGTASSSLQQRILLRVNAGAGAKLTIWRPDSVRNGFSEDASISAALLGEQTRALNDATVTPEAARDAAGVRARWSVRARYRKWITSQLRLSHVTFYQPTTNDFGRYTLEAVTVVSVPVWHLLDFTVTHRERIDSEAMQRGAPSNRDGQLLFGVRATFR